MTVRARAAAGDLLHRLGDALPVAWRHEPVFGGGAVATAVTLALFLLRVAGPHAPELDPVTPRPVTPLQGPVVPRGTPPPAQPPAEVPRIAPGRPLSDVTVAPTPDGDRFGTFTPGRHP